MYTRALTPNLGSGWMKYYLDEKGKVDFYEERDKETGDPPRYVMSPYEKYIDERRYMLCVADGAYVPALKRGDKFLNAITDVEFDVQDEHDLNSQIFLHVSFVACVGDL